MVSVQQVRGGKTCAPKGEKGATMIKFNSNIKVKCNWDKDRVCENGLLCGGCEYQPADDDKPNGKKDPVEVRFENDYGMMMPYCPSCGEMAYSTERCVFCGQRFIKADKPKNKTEIIGATEREDGSYKCDKCGKTEVLELVSHADGQGFFDYTYRCTCGNHITVRTILNEFE